MIPNLPYAFKLKSGDDVIADADTTEKNLIHFRISRLDDTVDKFTYTLQQGNDAGAKLNGSYNDEQEEAINTFLKKNT